jgi:uncharacterized protein (TIGR03437 family)
MRTLRFLSILGFAAGGALAQPSINFAANAASNITPGLPNSGIAQGALFILKGTNLGPPSFVVANSFPLANSIAGTSVTVTVGGQTRNAIMYYAGATQVAAILPSSTPLGTGTVTVTANGATSATLPITVVQNNIGIFTVSQTGAGDGIIYNGSSLVSAANAANPGETVVIWGTGLGPVSSNEAQPAVQTDMTNVPIEAWVGGKQANILFRGRNACCTAVDTVYITVPPGVTGCVVPVVLKIGNLVSNTVTMAIAASGRTCTPTNPAISSIDLQNLLNKPTISAGAVSLTRSVASSTISIPPLPPTTTVTRSDSGSGAFARFNVPASAVLTQTGDVATYGSCTVYTYSGQTPPPASATLSSVSLDAGAALTVTGPAGSKTMSKQVLQGTILYGAQLGNGTPGNFLDPGSYTITGPGGADVGSFTARINVPAPLTWTNQASIATVTRANGVTVTWTGGDPTGVVQITGTSFTSTSATNVVVAGFTCTARASDSTFTVPAIVLLALPPSGSNAGIPLPGDLTLSTGTSASFSATGIDYGLVTSGSSVGQSVTYQ